MLWGNKLTRFGSYVKEPYFFAQSEKAHKNESKGKNFLDMRISEGMHLFTSYKNQFTIWQFGYRNFSSRLRSRLVFLCIGLTYDKSIETQPNAGSQFICPLAKFFKWEYCVNGSGPSTDGVKIVSSFF